MITLSIIKADTGGFVGHTAVHPDMIAEARDRVERMVDSELLIDGHVACCGGDMSLIMTHGHGPDARLIHSFAGTPSRPPHASPSGWACTAPGRICCRTPSPATCAA